MGLFDKIKSVFGGSNITTGNNSPIIKGNGNVITGGSKRLFIDLSKQEGTLQDVLSKFGVKDLTAEVKLVLDKSGSMDSLYSNGTVQRTLERIATLAFKFDDNGVMETLLFSTSVEEKPDLTLENLETYSKKYLKNVADGGTNYAPSIELLTKQARAGEFKFPVYVIFITDGENWDARETEKAIKEASEFDMYFMFVGIGNENFSFLKSIDNLKGRKWDNAGFINFRDLNRVSDEKMYYEMLREFVEVYKEGQFKHGFIDLTK